MLHKLTVLVYVTALATASDSSEDSTTTTASPVQYVPVPSGPSIYTYSSSSPSKGATVEAYKTVTAHPPPSAYKTAPTPAPYVPSNFVQPQYVQIPGGYPSPVPVASYPEYPAPVGYVAVPNVVGPTAAGVPVYIGGPGYDGSVGPAYYTAGTPAPAYSGIPVAASPQNDKYSRRTQIKLVDSSDAYTTGYVPQYPGSVSTPAPQSISVPVEYPTAVGKDIRSHVVYAPVENAEGYNSPIHKPVATFAVQSAYANAHSPPAYSSAPDVSRVNFNGLGTSYVF